MQPQAALNAFDDVLTFEGQQAPSQEDQSAWLTRYIFVPFRDRPLTPDYMGYYGLSRLRRGIIQPIQAVEKPEPDYQVIKSVDAGDMTVTDGVHEMRLDKRSPKKIVDAILRLYAESNSQKTGVIEIECLRGMEDRNAARAFQAALLPEFYATAREQLSQLERAVPVSALCAQAQEALVFSTQTAIDWAEWHYLDLQAQIEDFGQTRIGKRKLSDLDRAVCEWLELPEPRLQSALKDFRSNLAPPTGQTQATAEEIPQVQCATCGEFSNLLPDGNPPKMCRACRAEFTVEAPAEESSEQMSEREARLRQKQQDAKARNGK